MVERQYIESAFLGQGYNSLTRELRNTAITYDPNDLTRENIEGINQNDDLNKQNNRQQSLLYFKQISNVIELAESLNISAGAEFGFLSSQAMGGLSGKVSFIKEQKIESNYFYVLVRYVVENESYRIKKAKLTEEAQKILKSHNGVEKFRKRFGDEYIVGFKTGGEYIALIKSLSVSKKEDEQSAANIQAELNLIIKKIDATGNYNSQSSERVDNKALEVASFRSGCKEFGFAVSLEEIGKEIKQLASDVRENGGIKNTAIFADYDQLITQDIDKIDDIKNEEFERQKYAIQKLEYRKMQYYQKLFNLKLDRENPSNSNLDKFKKFEKRWFAIEDCINELTMYPNLINDQKLKKIYRDEWEQNE